MGKKYNRGRSPTTPAGLPVRQRVRVDTAKLGKTDPSLEETQLAASAK